jgi:hypothetical protein
MQHSEVVTALENLIPSIKASGDPEAVMLKYAGDNNLSPAQLEKLAQVFNIAKTITFMDKSANRAGSFTLVDSNNLLAKYVDSTDVKAARRFTSGEQTTKASSTAHTIPVLNRFPTFGNPYLEEEENNKAAQTKAAGEAIDRIHVQAQAVELYEMTKYARQAQFDMEEDARTAFEKLARAVVIHDVEFPVLERDVVGVYGDELKTSVDNLASFIQQKYAHTVVRYTPTKKIALHRDTSGFASQLKFAHDALQTAKTIPLMLNEKAAMVKQSYTSTFNPTLPINATGPSGGPQSQTSAEDWFRHDLENTPREKKDTKQKDTKRKEQLKNEDTGAVAGVRHALNPDNYKGIMGMLMGGKDTVESASDLYSDEIKKRHNTVETAIRDTEFITNVQRILITDPIISEHDPKEVAQLATTLRQANPAIAANYHTLTYALREALQYGTMPTQTFTSLAESDAKLNRGE